MFDVMLRGGRVLDGAGNPDFPADVAIERGRIAAVDQLAQDQAREVVDPGLRWSSTTNTTCSRALIAFAAAPDERWRRAARLRSPTFALHAPR
jgi:hypothetical protein